MANLPVQKVTAESALPSSWRNELMKFSEAVGRKAFELFEKYGHSNGHDLDQWLDAEKQIVTFPRLELLDTGTEFELRVAAAGFDAKDVEVTALPDAVLVKAQTSAEAEEKEGEICYCEFSDKSLFRRIPLAQPIDIDAVTAQLEKGVLKIVAPKAAGQKQKERKIEVAAA